MPKEAPLGGVQGDYVGMDDYGDEDEVCLSTRPVYPAVPTFSLLEAAKQTAKMLKALLLLIKYCQHQVIV